MDLGADALKVLHEEVHRVRHRVAGFRLLEAGPRLQGPGAIVVVKKRCRPREVESPGRPCVRTVGNRRESEADRLCAVVAEQVRVDVDELLINRIAAVRESGERRAHVVVHATIPEPLRAVRRKRLELLNVLVVGPRVLEHRPRHWLGEDEVVQHHDGRVRDDLSPRARLDLGVDIDQGIRRIRLELTHPLVELDIGMEPHADPG